MSLTKSSVAATCVVIMGVAVPAFGQSAPGTTFRDCAQCPEMVVVPRGTFVMGAAPGEEQREGAPERFRGRSQHRVAVNVGAFALGRYEVTYGEFSAFVAATGHRVQGGCYFVDDNAHNDDPDREVDPARWEILPHVNYISPGYSQSMRHPAVCVSWNDAAAYAAWLGRKTGKRYRLPSEAEWEFAARAGTRTTEPWGKSASDACSHANVWDESVKSTYSKAINMYPCSDGFVHAAPVGSFLPNRFGLYDMIGNVWEWVQDCSNPTLAGMPVNAAARLSGDCSRRVIRGGGWYNTWYFTPASAHPPLQLIGGTRTRFSHLGFRVARSL